MTYRYFLEPDRDKTLLVASDGNDHKIIGAFNYGNHGTTLTVSLGMNLGTIHGREFQSPYFKPNGIEILASRQDFEDCFVENVDEIIDELFFEDMAAIVKFVKMGAIKLTSYNGSPVFEVNDGGLLLSLAFPRCAVDRKHIPWRRAYKQESNPETGGSFYIKKEYKDRVAECKRCGKVHIKKNYSVKGGWFCSKNCMKAYSPRIKLFRIPKEDMGESTTELISSNRAFGYELELTDFDFYVNEKRIADICDIKSDGSIRAKHWGGEFVTKPLRGDNGLKALDRLIDYIHMANVKPNYSCGTHIHIEANDFHKSSRFKRLTGFVKANEKFLTADISNNRIDTNYVKLLPSHNFSVNDTFAKRFKKCIFPSDSGRSIPPNEVLERAQKTKDPGVTRYFWFNVSPLFYFGTVEIRTLQSTTSRHLLKNWARLWVGIFDAVRNNTLKAQKYKSIYEIIDKLPYDEDIKRELKNTNWKAQY